MIQNKLYFLNEALVFDMYALMCIYLFLPFVYDII